VPTQLLGQTTPVDTIYINDDSMGGISKYSARDSVYADLKKKQLHLYGEATVESEDMNLKAGYILIDMNTEEVTATYVLDEEGKMIESHAFHGVILIPLFLNER